MNLGSPESTLAPHREHTPALAGHDHETVEVPRNRSVEPAHAPIHAPHTPPARRSLRALVWLAVIAIVAGGAWALGKHQAKRDAREAMPTGVAAAKLGDATQITVAPIVVRKVERAVEAMGTVHGFEEIVLGAEVEGRVVAINHDVADIVRPGEILMSIDPTNYQLAVEQAQRGLAVELAKIGVVEPPADGDKFDVTQLPMVMHARALLERARAKVERVRLLAESKAVSREEVDNSTSDFLAAQASYANELLMSRGALATVKLKQAELAIAQKNLADSQIRVPMPTKAPSGKAHNVAYSITRRDVSEGSLVRPGDDVFSLVITDTLKLRVSVAERFSSEVKLGQAVDVSVSALAAPVRGEVTRINPSVDSTTRTFQAEIEIANADGKLKPGSFAKANILTRIDSKATTVPLSSLVEFAGITKVFRLEDGKAVEVPVKLGLQSQEWAEIVEPPLADGTLVITSGHSMLAQGSAVEVRSDDKPVAKNPKPANEASAKKVGDSNAEAPAKAH